MKTFTAYRCTECKGFNVKSDAWQNLNTGETSTFDATHCDDCEGECNTEMVTVVALDDTLIGIIEAAIDYADSATLEEDPVPEWVGIAATYLAVPEGETK